jgi:hypothetical protein
LLFFFFIYLFNILFILLLTYIFTIFKYKKEHVINEFFTWISIYIYLDHVLIIITMI